MTVQLPPCPTLKAIAEELDRPLLPENPFPTCITARNSATIERFGEWAEAQRSRVEADLKRLRDRDVAPEAWELSALATAVRQWRVFAAFHRLHEEHWCPGLLFRLATKTDLLTLCDPAMGLLEAAAEVPGAGEPEQETVETEPTAAVTGDGAAGAAEVAVVVAAAVDTEGASPEEPFASEGEPPSEESPSERVPGGALPPLRVNRVWSALPTYTKKQLEAVYERFGVGLWSQFERTAGGPRFYASMRKAEMLAFVQRVVRHHACLDAAERLTESQLDALHDWMRFNLAEQYHRDEDLRIAARLFGDFQAAAALSRDGDGLSPEAWNQYRKADLRRIAAFCYHRFYEAETAAVCRSEAA